MTNKLKHFYKRLSFLIVAIFCLTIPFSFSSVAFANSESNATPNDNENIDENKVVAYGYWDEGESNTNTLTFINGTKLKYTFKAWDEKWQWGQGKDNLEVTFNYFNNSTKCYILVEYKVSFIWTQGQSDPNNPYSPYKDITKHIDDELLYHHWSNDFNAAGKQNWAVERIELENISFKCFTYDNQLVETKFLQPISLNVVKSD